MTGLMLDGRSLAEVVEMLRPALGPVALECSTVAQARRWIAEMRRTVRLQWDHPHEGGIVRFTFAWDGTYLSLLKPDTNPRHSSNLEIHWSVKWTPEELADLIVTHYQPQQTLFGHAA